LRDVDRMTKALRKPMRDARLSLLGVREMGRRPPALGVTYPSKLPAILPEWQRSQETFSETSAHHELRGRLLALLLITFILDALGTVLLIWLGNHSFRRSAVWSTSSLLTGGAALDIGGGRHYWFGLALELWAVTAVGAAAGSFGAFFHRLHLERGGVRHG
jgi:hypothetical protein